MHASRQQQKTHTADTHSVAKTKHEIVNASYPGFIHAFVCMGAVYIAFREYSNDKTFPLFALNQLLSCYDRIWIIH